MHKLLESLKREIERKKENNQEKKHRVIGCLEMTREILLDYAEFLIEKSGKEKNSTEIIVSLYFQNDSFILKFTKSEKTDRLELVLLNKQEARKNNSILLINRGKPCGMKSVAHFDELRKILEYKIIDVKAALF